MFLVFIIAFYFQGRRYAAVYEEKPSAGGGEMIIKVKPVPAVETVEEVLPPPVPGERK